MYLIYIFVYRTKPRYVTDYPYVNCNCSGYPLYIFPIKVILYILFIFICNSYALWSDSRADMYIQICSWCIFDFMTPDYSCSRSIQLELEQLLLEHNSGSKSYRNTEGRQLFLTKCRRHLGRSFCDWNNC